MDLKTLEYMEERAKKGRELVKRIDKLRTNVKNISGNAEVWFAYKGSIYSRFEGYELVEDIKKQTIEAVEREIARLEKELAEL